MTKLVMITPYYYTGKLEGREFICYCDSKYELFRKVSYIICFDDCETEMYDLDKISCEGRECGYAGWEPGMVYNYLDLETKELIWSGRFEEWDH